MGIQSQDIEKQRQATQGGRRPKEERTKPHDRPPGQPHDPAPQCGQGNRVERDPTQDSSYESRQEQKRRRELSRPS
jgi:hypothetical protein